jgi:hypothetical protein
VLPALSLDRGVEKINGERLHMTGIESALHLTDLRVAQRQKQCAMRLGEKILRHDSSFLVDRSVAERKEDGDLTMMDVLCPVERSEQVV